MEAKSKVDAQNEWGSTPLHTAARYGRKECVQVMICVVFFSTLTFFLQVLLAARAQLELVDKHGRTALASAIFFEQHQCAEILLHAGANLRKVNVPIPDWMHEIVAKRNNLKAAFTVLYGILRRRIVVPCSYKANGEHIPRDMVRVISYMAVDTPFDARWNLPTIAPSKKAKACKHKCKDKSSCAHACCKK